MFTTITFHSVIRAACGTAEVRSRRAQDKAQEEPREWARQRGVPGELDWGTRQRTHSKVIKVVGPVT